MDIREKIRKKKMLKKFELKEISRITNLNKDIGKFALKRIGPGETLESVELKSVLLIKSVIPVKDQDFLKVIYRYVTFNGTVLLEEAYHHAEGKREIIRTSI